MPRGETKRSSGPRIRSLSLLSRRPPPKSPTVGCLPILMFSVSIYIAHCILAPFLPLAQSDLIVVESVLAPILAMQSHQVYLFCSFFCSDAPTRCREHVCL